MAGPMPIGRFVKSEVFELPFFTRSAKGSVVVSGDEVHITKHGRVVARLVPPTPPGVVLGLGVANHGEVPDVDDLHWTDDELGAMFGGPAIPE